MLEAGADVNARDLTGMTSLTYMILGLAWYNTPPKSFVIMIDKLTEKGAEKNLSAIVGDKYKYFLDYTEINGTAPKFIKARKFAERIGIIL